MKILDLPKVLWFLMPLDGRVVDTQQLITARREFNKNSHEVILSSHAIEANLKDAVSDFFVKDSEKRALFSESIISTEHFSFAAAMKVFQAIIKKLGALPDREFNELQELLYEVMHYRNALTHGRLIQNVNTIVLFYHQGGPKNVQITDEYWDKVESKFKRAHELLDKSISALQPKPAHEQFGNPGLETKVAPA